MLLREAGVAAYVGAAAGACAGSARVLRPLRRKSPLVHLRVFPRGGAPSLSIDEWPSQLRRSPPRGVVAVQRVVWYPQVCELSEGGVLGETPLHGVLHLDGAFVLVASDAQIQAIIRVDRVRFAERVYAE